MDHFRKHIAIACISLVVTCLSAVSKAPVVERACFDKSTSTVTVYFKAQPDACGSFVTYELYGRDNAFSLFTKLTSLSTLNASQVQCVLPNNKQWEVYISTRYACNGIDTLNSDTVYVDLTPPSYTEPDSVSVDFSTQRLLAGWTKAPEPDVMGYFIYKVDPGTGNNVQIDNQNVLSYMFTSGTFNTAQGGNRVSLAAYDSCGNGSVISQFHSPVLLQFNTGQNVNYKCTKKLYIDWSAYKGWITDSFEVHSWDSKRNTWRKEATVNGSTLSYMFQIPYLNENFSFYVRARKQGSTVSSSSNRIDINLTDFPKPAYCGIGHVSVRKNGTIEITAAWDPISSVFKVLLQTAIFGSNSWTTISGPPPSAGEVMITQTGLSTSSTKYCYRLLLLNPCNEGLDTSTIHTSMVLKKKEFDFTWNDYWAWKAANYETNIYRRSKLGSTWNSESSSPDSILTLTDTTQPICFRVLSLITGVNNKPLDSAWSNEICLRVFDTTLVPGAFTPGGINPVFKVINPNLEPGQASMHIYNRWGEKLFSGDAIVGWTGVDGKGEFVGPGFYPYLINIVTEQKRYSVKGVVMVLR